MDLRSGASVHLGEHWWSSFSPTGGAGMGAAEKGEEIVERAASGLVALARELRARPNPVDTRIDLH